MRYVPAGRLVKLKKPLASDNVVGSPLSNLPFRFESMKTCQFAKPVSPPSRRLLLLASRKTKPRIEPTRKLPNEVLVLLSPLLTTTILAPVGGAVCAQPVCNISRTTNVGGMTAVSGEPVEKPLYVGLTAPA